MQTAKTMHWRDGEFWFGYLLDCPDYRTQGETLDGLNEHLMDLHHDLAGGHVSGLT